MRFGIHLIAPPPAIGGLDHGLHHLLRHHDQEDGGGCQQGFFLQARGAPWGPKKIPWAGSVDTARLDPPPPAPTPKRLDLAAEMLGGFAAVPPLGGALDFGGKTPGHHHRGGEVQHVGKSRRADRGGGGGEFINATLRGPCFVPLPTPLMPWTVKTNPRTMSRGQIRRATT